MEKDAYASHLKVQNDHWWFNARERILETFIHPHLTTSPKPSILDIGSGGGRIMDFLARYGNVNAVDPEKSVIDFINDRFKAPIGRVGSLPDHIPHQENSFDIVTNLDVMEHVEQDGQSIKTIYDLLAPGGIYLMTVPAFRFLWSYHDDQSHHLRRYTKKQIAQKLKASGFEILRISYFNTFLFLPIYLFRLFLKLLGKQENRTKNDMEMGGKKLGKILEKIFMLENSWLKRASLPFGYSIIALCRKPINNNTEKLLERAG